MNNIIETIGTILLYGIGLGLGMFISRKINDLFDGDIVGKIVLIVIVIMLIVVALINEGVL